MGVREPWESISKRKEMANIPHSEDPNWSGYWFVRV